MHNYSQQVAVVMSTYNGSDYLEQQIESIFAQEGVEFGIFVRDDGSQDNTLEVLESLAKRAEVPFVIERGTNCGVTESFFRAVGLVPKHYPFIALCDQDDIWHPDKLARALHELGKLDQNKPLLYCSEYNFCDEHMRRTGKSALNRIGITPSRMLYENVCSGNTMVINRRLAHLAIGDGVEGVYCHDWWLALVASHFGKVVFDDVPCLEYRRTGSNASPTGANAVRLLAFRIRTFLAQGEFGRINQQNSTFLSRYYHLLDPSQRRVLSAFTHGPTLLKTTYPRRLRQKMHEELALRLLLLLGY